MSKKNLKVVCPYCGAERCDCQKIDLQPDKISEVDLIAPARAVLDAAKKAFENPEIEADDQRWLAERYVDYNDNGGKTDD